MAPSDKLEITEQICGYSPFQNGINQDSKGLMQEGDWLVKLDLKDTYLTIPIHSSHQRFQWQSQTWEFKVLPEQRLLKTHEAGSIHTEEAGNQIDPLPR